MVLALHAGVLVDRHDRSVVAVTGTRWEAPTLEGRIVRLEPLSEGHAAGLWEASRDPRTWRWLPIRQPQTPEELEAWIEEALARAAGGVDLPLVTFHADEVVGSTRFLALRPEHRSLEIGWTWLHPSAWGGGVNVEAKLLMLAPRVRGVGLPACGAEDRRAERAVTRRDGGHGRDVRGDPPQAHARP